MNINLIDNNRLFSALKLTCSEAWRYLLFGGIYYVAWVIISGPIFQLIYSNSMNLSSNHSSEINVAIEVINQFNTANLILLPILNIGLYIIQFRIIVSIFKFYEKDNNIQINSIAVILFLIVRLICSCFIDMWIDAILIDNIRTNGIQDYFVQLFLSSEYSQAHITFMRYLLVSILSYYLAIRFCFRFFLTSHSKIEEAI